MSTQTVQTAGAPALPRVNLMPPEIAEAERFRKLQLGMGCAVLASAVIVGGLYYHEHSNVSSAQSALASANAQHVALQTRLSSLDQVAQTYSEVHAKQVLLGQAMGQEIRWSYILNDLSFRIPTNVWLTGIQASETSAGGTSSSSATSSSTGITDPDAIGTVSFTGVGLRHDDVAAWLDALAKEKGFADPSFSNSTESAIGERSVDDFSTAVNLEQSALSNRYTTEAGS